MMDNMNFNGSDDYVQEPSDIVDKIYSVNDEYKEELNKTQPNRDKLARLLNKQLMIGLELQQFPNNGMY